MITAKEAKELSGPSTQDYLYFIEEKIKAAASDKKKQIIIRDTPYASWLYSEKDMSPAAKSAIETIKNNGFSVSLYYCEHSMAVDMGLVVSWE